MKFFNKNNDSNPFGAGDIIQDETAAIISELGYTDASDDITFERIKPNPPQARSETPSQSQNRPTPVAQPQSQNTSQQKEPSKAASKPQASASQVQATSTTPQQAAAPHRQSPPAAKPKSNEPVTKTATSGRIQFGIKDAIDLIHSLPEHNTELVIPVVIKTLASANIHLEDIITDAEKYEKILETRSNRLIEQIEDMESKVATLSDQLMNMNSQLEEITNVRELLTLTFESDAENDEISDEDVAALMEEDLDEVDVDDIKSAIDGIPIHKNP